MIFYKCIAVYRVIFAGVIFALLHMQSVFPSVEFAHADTILFKER